MWPQRRFSTGSALHAVADVASDQIAVGAAGSVACHFARAEDPPGFLPAHFHARPAAARSHAAAGHAAPAVASAAWAHAAGSAIASAAWAHAAGSAIASAARAHAASTIAGAGPAVATSCAARAETAIFAAILGGGRQREDEGSSEGEKGED
jgi:hypothetical protein